MIAMEKTKQGHYGDMVGALKNEDTNEVLVVIYRSGDLGSVPELEAEAVKDYGGKEVDTKHLVLENGLIWKWGCSETVVNDFEESTVSESPEYSSVREDDSIFWRTTVLVTPNESVGDLFSRDEPVKTVASGDVVEENKTMREKKCKLFVASTPNAEDSEGSKFYFGDVQDAVFKVDDSQ